MSNNDSVLLCNPSEPGWPDVPVGPGDDDGQLPGRRPPPAARSGPEPGGPQHRNHPAARRGPGGLPGHGSAPGGGSGRAAGPGPNRPAAGWRGPAGRTLEGRCFPAGPQNFLKFFFLFLQPSWFRVARRTPAVWIKTSAGTLQLLFNCWIVI